MLTSGTPRRGPNALHDPLPSRPRLPERPHVHRLLQRDSGRPAPAGIIRARALLGGDAARGRPGWPGRLSATKAAVTRAAFLASTLRSRGFRAHPSGGPEWAEPRQSHAQSSPPADAAPALETSHRRPRPGTNPSRTLDAPCSVQETRKIQNAPFCLPATESRGLRNRGQGHFQPVVLSPPGASVSPVDNRGVRLFQRLLARRQRGREHGN